MFNILKSNPSSKIWKAKELKDTGQPSPLYLMMSIINYAAHLFSHMVGTCKPLVANQAGTEKSVIRIEVVDHDPKK